MKKLLDKKSFILILVLTAFAASAPHSYAKDKEKDVDEELKLQSGDEAGNEVKALKAELLISQSDQKALIQLTKLIKKYQGSGLEPSLYLRLAELYMRRAKTSTFFEVHRDDTSAVRFSPMATSNSSSKVWITKAVTTYDLIEKDYVQFGDMDLVLFNNAFARQILGQDEEALRRYRKVINEFPHSPLVPDSYLSLGEALFNKKKFAEAFAQFQKIREFPDARVFPYGVYKGAWCLYNMSRAPEALKQLEEVVKYSRTPGEDGNNHLDLSREALDDMVVFYEDVKKPSDAVEYFRVQSGDVHAGEYALKLGKIYQRHGKFNNVEIVYSDLIRSIPLAAERPEMHRDLMEGFETAKNRDKVITNLEALADLCQETTPWAKSQDAESKKECWKQLDETGRLYATKWHKEFIKTKNLDLGFLTSRAYESLLKNNQKIGGSEDKLRYQYAELLFQQQNYRKASEQYSKAAHVTTDLKIRHDASYGAIVALEKATNDKWSDVDEKEFTRLSQDYITLNPKGQYITDIRFKKAFIAYEKNRYDEAAPQLRELALSNSTNPRGVKATSLYLDTLNIQKKYALLRDESQMFLSKYKYDAETTAQIIKIHQESALTVDQNLETSGKFVDAMNGYYKFVQESPNSALADKALYNAVRNANLSSDLVMSAKLSEELITRYPHSPFKLELGRALVVLYEAQAQLSQAAVALLNVAEWEKSEQKETSKTVSTLLEAADYYALDNNESKASGLYHKIIEQFPHSKESGIAFERLEAYAEKTSDWSKTSHLLDQMVEMNVQPAASIAMDKLAQHVYASGDDEKAFKVAKKTIAMRNEENVSHRALAQSRLIQAKILEKEFASASVKAKSERLSLVLSIKTEKLEHAQKAYQDVISFKDRQSAIEALVHLAKCYEQFSTALAQIEAPAEASPADKKKFLQEIENLALPIEEKNAETLSLALKQAQDLHLYDGTVTKIQEQLDRLSKRSNKDITQVDIKVPERVLPVISSGGAS